jgi:hypothetical protein
VRCCLRANPTDLVGLERRIMQKGANPVDKFEWPHSNQRD